MKKMLLFVAGIVLSISISAQCPLTTAVDFTATDCHGTEVHLFDLLDGGQYVLIDFFYTTCGPCQQATPKVAEAYGLLGCNDFEVFFMEITPYDNNAACQTWCNNYGIEYPTIGTNGGGNTICNTYQIGYYPTLILIAPDRSIVINDLWPISSAMTVVNALSPYGIQQHECGSTPTCEAPQNVAAAVNEDKSITVTWDAVEGASSYNLYVDGELTAEEITTTTITSPADQTPGTYCATVVTVCENGLLSEHSEEACVTIEMSVNEIEDHISIYPNPANHFVKIECQNMQQISILNLKGQQLLMQKVSGDATTISIENYPEGTYFIQILNADHQIGTQRFVISR